MPKQQDDLACQHQRAERKKYLFLVNDIGFIYSHFWEIALRIQAAGWEVIIVGGAASDPKRAVAAGMRFVSFQPMMGIGNFAAELRNFVELRRVIRSLRPDFLHLISLKNVLLGGIVARFERTSAVLGAITGLGTLFVEESLSYRMLRPLILLGLRFMFANKRSILAVENSDDKAFLLRHGVCHAWRTVVIPGAGLDGRVIVPSKQRRSTITILCVSRMIKNKGILQLAEAARILRSRGLEFSVCLVGDVDPHNPTSLRLEELLLLEKDGHVKWLGRCSNIPDLLREASIFCLPTYYREGLPRSLVEACAAGLPIVTTDVPGCREVVLEGVNGYLVPPQDIGALADALARLIENPELRERMGNYSRRRFEERLSISSVLKAFTNCYSILGVPIQIIYPTNGLSAEEI